MRISQSDLLIALLLSSLLIAATANAAPCEPGTSDTYDVGPGKPYANIGDVPLNTFGPGDTMRIFYRATPYNQKITLVNSGAAGNREHHQRHGVHVP